MKAYENNICRRDAQRPLRNDFTLQTQSLFKIDIEDVLEKIIEKRPTLRGKHLELYFD